MGTCAKQAAASVPGSAEPSARGGISATMRSTPATRAAVTNINAVDNSGPLRQRDPERDPESECAIQLAHAHTGLELHDLIAFCYQATIHARNLCAPGRIVEAQYAEQAAIVPLRVRLSSPELVARRAALGRSSQSQPAPRDRRPPLPAQRSATRS